MVIINDIDKAKKAYPINYKRLAKSLINQGIIEATEIELITALRKAKEYSYLRRARKVFRDFLVFVLRYQYRLTIREISLITGAKMQSCQKIRHRELNDLKLILKDKNELYSSL